MTLSSFQKEYFDITFYFAVYGKASKFPKTDIAVSMLLISSSHIMGTAIDVLIFFPFIPSSRFTKTYLPHHVMPGFYLDLPNGNKNEDIGIVLLSLLTLLFCVNCPQKQTGEFTRPRWSLVSILIA
jgi:hypothetical protein